MTHKNLTLFQKLKKLAAELEGNEELLSNLVPQDDSYNSNEPRDHIITNAAVIPVLICQTGYTSPMIVHSLTIISRKKDRYNKKILSTIGKRESENDVVWIILQDR